MGRGNRTKVTSKRESPASSGSAQTRSRKVNPKTSINLSRYKKQISFSDRLTSDLYTELFSRYLDENSLVEYGRNRAVIIGESQVLKFPLNDSGISDNYFESIHRDEYIPIANCELVMESVDKSELAFLQMERVESAIGEKDLPYWTGFVDGRQVGYDRNGKLVAYDLGAA